MNINLSNAPAPEVTLSEAEAIEQRLQDGLAETERQQAEHRDALAGIPEALATLAQVMHQAEAHLTRLQQEQDEQPRRINAARAVLVGAMGTPAESQAREQIDALQARQQVLPQEIAEAQAAEQKMRAAYNADCARLEQQRAEHQAAMTDLASFATALREQVAEQRRQIGHAKLEQVQVERQERIAALEQAEQRAAEARAALLALDSQAQEALERWPDLLSGYRGAHIPVDDTHTQRLLILLGYRRAFASWVVGGNWSLGYPLRWFLIPHTELAYPDHARMAVTEIEQALAEHIREVQQHR